VSGAAIIVLSSRSHSFTLDMHRTLDVTVNSWSPQPKV
jgi:hypothetical protein